MKFVVLEKAGKSFLIWDTGLGAAHAKALAKAGHKVFYFSEWFEPLTKWSRYAVGLGIPGVTKVPSLEGGKDFFDYIDDVDVIAFIALGKGDMADWLKKKGYSVYGPGRGERLETDRVYAKGVLRKADILVPPYEVLNNVDDVLELINKSKDDSKIVKINIFRGDLESQSHLKDYESAKLALTDLAVKLGPFSNHFTFVVEDRIKDVVTEAGFDLFFNGKNFLKPYLWGYLAGRFYVGRFSDELPEPLKTAAEKLEPILRSLDYRGALSTEFLVDKKKNAYLIDLTARMPCPLSYIYTHAIRNYGEVIYACAKGEDVEIKPAGEYAAYFDLMALAFGSLKTWLKVDFPKNIEQNINLKQPNKVDGNWYTYLGDDPSVATVVAAGSSVENVLTKLYKLSQQIDTASIDTDEVLGADDKVIEAIENGKKVGLEF